MLLVDDLLAPARTLEALARRAARGHRPAWRLLFEHLPAVIRAETRWLYPALLGRQPGDATRAWLLPASGEHEQILDLFERVGPHPPGPRDAMFVAALSTLRAHLRHERAWIGTELERRGPGVDHAALARYLAACRPLAEQAGRMA